MTLDTDTTNRRSSRSGAPQPAGRVLLIELTDEQQFVTSGQQAYQAHVVGPVLRGLGPQIEDIVIHAQGTAFSTNFKYKVTAQRSFDGETWTDFASDVLGEQTATTYVTSSPYTTRGDFGLFIRFQVEVSDTASKEVGSVSVVAAIRLHR